MPNITLDLEEVQDGLPPVCMRCGARTRLFKERTFTWTPQWIGLIAVGVPGSTEGCGRPSPPCWSPGGEGGFAFGERGPGSAAPRPVQAARRKSRAQVGTSCMGGG